LRRGERDRDRTLSLPRIGRELADLLILPLERDGLFRILHDIDLLLLLRDLLTLLLREFERECFLFMLPVRERLILLLLLRDRLPLVLPML